MLGKSIVGFQKWVLKSLGMPLFIWQCLLPGCGDGGTSDKAGEWQVKFRFMHLPSQGAIVHKQPPLSVLQIQDYMCRTDCMIT